MSPIPISGLLVVTPVQLHADALARTLETVLGAQHVVGATCHADAIALALQRRPAVILVDFGMDNLVDCLEAIRRVAPSTPMMVFGVGQGDGSGERLIRAAQAGATSFADTRDGIEQLSTALHLAASGGSYCSPRVAGSLLQAINAVRLGGTRTHGVDASHPAELLSHRERTVAELIMSGLTNRQIAQRLVVAEATVKSHVHAILHKLGITRREEVRIWMSHAPGEVVDDALDRVD